MAAPLPANEAERLAALRRYGILDTPREPVFDEIVMLAARICDVPMARIGFIDHDRVWFKAVFGAGPREVPREQAPCAHTITVAELFVVRDAHLDERFIAATCPRFYAAAPLVTPEGYALGTLSVSGPEPRDVNDTQREALLALTHQVMALLEARAVSRRNRELLERMSDGFCVADRDWYLLEVNPRFSAMTGKSPDELIGRRLWDAFPRNNQPEVVAHAEQALRENSPVQWQAYSPVLGRWVESTVRVNEDRIEIFSRDIDQQKRTEEELRESDSRFAAIVNQATVGISQTDLEGRFIFANDRFAAILGRSREDLLGRSIAELTHAEDLSRNLALFKSAIETGAPFVIDKRYIRPDGTTVWVSNSVTVIRDAAGRPRVVLAVTIDISERKMVEAALRESEERRQMAQEAAEIGTWDLELRTGAQHWSPEQYKLFAIAPGEITTYRHFLERLHPDDRKRINAEVTAAIAGRPYETEFRIVRDDGVRWIFAKGRVIRDDAGVPVRMMGVNMDITDRRRTEDELRELAATLEHRVEREVREREDAQAALAQAQKMEAIGQLTGGVAHDFNNLLTAILGNLEIVEAHAQGERVRNAARTAISATERGEALTRQLLAFSRKQHLKTHPTDLNRLVHGMGELLARTLGGTVAVAVDLVADAWPVLVDSNQIELALLNLAINARDAMPNGGTLTVSARNVTVEDIDGDTVPGDYVRLSIADTGTGMSEAVTARALEPFFTTKEVGKGTGLGLSHVYGVVRQLGGAVRLRSRLGEGTTVDLYLPRSREPAAATKASIPPVATRQDRPAVILVIDDDADVREFAATCLRELGYEVLEAENGAAALFLVESGRPIDLLVVDFAMPGLNGTQTIAALRERRPELRALYITGFTEAPGLVVAPGDGLLRKPFRIADLSRKVTQALAHLAQSETAVGRHG